ncbi:MAG TPA: HAD-IB family phosphatase [Candidatus Saccharimonadales bacterium]|nr:HAD-IB family phosphatase [Candidatus Saccharimonadales bacterium]
MPEPLSPDNGLSDLWTPDSEPHYILDWDSTVCQKETLDFVAEFVLSDVELVEFRACTDRGMTGNLSFSESLAQRFSMLRVRRDQVVEAGELLVEHLDPTAVARRPCIERNQDRIHVVSGGFEELILPSVSRLGIRPDHVYANRFVYDEDDYVVGADPERLTAHDGGKAAQVKALALDGLKVVIGDGHNDLLIKQLGCADVFIAYTRHQHREGVVAGADASTDSFAEPLLT